MNTDEQLTLLKLAREAILSPILAPDDLAPGRSLTQALCDPRGAFVTLKIREQVRGREAWVLRGCIGRMIADLPLYLTIIDTARKSAFSDPRFPAVQPAEMEKIRLSVSVLEPAADLDDVERIVIGRDGLELEKGGHRAVFLPQVAVEQNWTIPRYLEELAVKARLPRDGWQGAKLRSFRTENFREEG